ncbi:MAG: glycosyltransferase family 2 protein [Nitrospirota bacterium]
MTRETATGQSEAPTLSVVIPVFNERATIAEILRRVQLVKIDKELVVVDDGSTDGTREFLQELVKAKTLDPPAVTLGDGSRLPVGNVTVLFQPTNRGKGAAVRRGFQEARGAVVLVQDADLEYDPQNYAVLLEPIEKGVADVVYGSRFLGGPHRVLFYWHYLANTILTTLSNMMTNVNLSDVWTCYKVFRREVVAKLDLKENRFGFEQEVTAKVAKMGCRIYEVPISYYGRTYAEGKKITWKDGVRGLWCILRYTVFD